MRQSLDGEGWDSTWSPEGHEAQITPPDPFNKGPHTVLRAGSAVLGAENARETRATTNIAERNYLTTRPSSFPQHATTRTQSLLCSTFGAIATVNVCGFVVSDVR